jgi:transketolase
MFDAEQSEALARTIRASTLRMVHRANASHIGGCLSMADLLAVLYGTILRVDPNRPDDPDRDRFLLSKGHSAAAVYSCLAARGFFPEAWLDTYCQDGSRLSGHLTHHGMPGVEVSTGSLGHGLSLAAGMALAGKRRSKAATWRVSAAERSAAEAFASRLHGAYRVFVILSDGECDEGSIWEAALFAPFHKLDNLVAIVDANAIQSFGSVKEVLDLEPFADKWRAFGWAVREIDGHDHQQIHDALAHLPAETNRPTLVLARTVKGKGVDFMENRLEWHYRSPNATQLEQALELVGCDA